MELIAGIEKIPASDMKIIERYFDRSYPDKSHQWIVNRIHRDRGFQSVITTDTLSALYFSRQLKNGKEFG